MFDRSDASCADHLWASERRLHAWTQTMSTDCVPCAASRSERQNEAASQPGITDIAETVLGIFNKIYICVYICACVRWRDSMFKVDGRSQRRVCAGGFSLLSSPTFGGLHIAGCSACTLGNVQALTATACGVHESRLSCCTDLTPVQQSGCSKQPGAGV